MLRTHSSGAFESKLKSNMAASGLPRASCEEPCDTATANFLANKRSLHTLLLIMDAFRLDCRIPRNSSCSAQPPKMATRSAQALGTKGSATSGNE